MKRLLQCLYLVLALLVINSVAIAQSGANKYGNVWVQGGWLNFSSTFNGNQAPVNQLAYGPGNFYFTHGNTNICDSVGNLILISDGFNLYDKNFAYLDNGQTLSPQRFAIFNDNWSVYSQASIILPFGNGIYRMITPSVSDDSCQKNWEPRISAYYDLLLYHEIDMKANGGAGRVTKRMMPLLQNVKLSKTQMMACRHGDGKSWWLIKHASDTNMIYKFLLTEHNIYGPFVQGFTGAAAHFGIWDQEGQSMFSMDGTKYATTLQIYGKVFVADFDRCTGMFSNPQVYNVPVGSLHHPVDSSLVDVSTSGVCFSPNGRYLYVSSFNNIRQFDLAHPTAPNAWTFLGGLDTTFDVFQEYTNIYPGSDGRLYIGNWNGLGGEMSVINYPDSNGIAAGFCPKCLRFPGYLELGIMRFTGAGTPPCMPNYNLGPANPICYPTEVKKIEQEAAEFSIYPNPSRGIIRVNSSLAGTLMMYDALGRTVYTAQLIKAGEITLTTSSNLLAGTYQYQFTAKSGQRANGKFVVIR